MIVRVPDWWKANRPPRPVVSVKIDGRRGTRLGIDALLDFSVGVALDGEPLSEDELQELLDIERRAGAAQGHSGWRSIARSWPRRSATGKTSNATSRERASRSSRGCGCWRGDAGPRYGGGPSGGDAAVGGFDGRRRARRDAGAGSARPKFPANPSAARLARRAAALSAQSAWSWLHFLTQLGLGACLADDMGLGKTVQVIALLLDEQRERKASRAARSKAAHRVCWSCRPR